MIKIEKYNYINIMSSQNPFCARVRSGDRILFEVDDALGGRAREYHEKKLHHDEYKHLANPSTGPVYIEEAKAGDTLKISIEKIELTHGGFISRSDWIFGRLAQGRDDFVEFSPRGEQLFYQGRLIPAEPMIGMIGTAPPEPVHCCLPGDHGGNMDTTMIKAGARLFLPVFTEGALLAVGDIHACQGDGEVSGQGIEFAADVTVSVEVIKDRPVRRPRIENQDVIAWVASGSTLKEAKQIVLEDVGEYLMQHAGLSFEDAFGLAIFYGQLRICQIVNPLLTVRYEISREKLALFCQNPG